MSEYIFPDILGGGRHSTYEPKIHGGLEDSSMLPFVVDSHLVLVPKEMLTEVDLSLPPEPPYKSIVLINRCAYQRVVLNMYISDGWQKIGSPELYTWATLWSYGSPIYRLVTECEPIKK